MDSHRNTLSVVGLDNIPTVVNNRNPKQRQGIPTNDYSNHKQEQHQIGEHMTSCSNTKCRPNMKFWKMKKKWLINDKSCKISPCVNRRLKIKYYCLEPYILELFASLFFILIGSLSVLATSTNPHGGSII